MNEARQRGRFVPSRSQGNARTRLALVAALLSFGVTGAAVAAGDDAPREALRVCQDPNNLPFSNEKQEGFENRIAELFAKAMGVPVTYYNYPQRFVFIRNTLTYKLPGKDFPCDIIMGLPVGFDQTAVTKPYYRSTYALVFPTGKGMDHVKTVEDFLQLDPAKLASLRIGLYDKSPASKWLDRHNLVDQGVPYQTVNMESDYYPGRMVERDLASGRIDVAILWGPVASYYAKAVVKPPMNVVPMKSEPGIKFDFAVGMGVRYGEPKWRQQVEALIDAHGPEIEAILQSYHVPIVDESFSSPRN